MFINTSLEPQVTDRDRKLWGQTMKFIFNAWGFSQKHKNRKKPLINCHTICRALEHCVQELKVVDGWCIGMERDKNVPPNSLAVKDLKHCRHSWLLTPDAAIIDPYPVGFIITNPLLLPKTGQGSFFGYEMYLPDSRITDEVSTASLYKSVVALAEYMQKGK